MDCSLFNICGGCTLPLLYEEQFDIKIKNWKQKFHVFQGSQPLSVFTSPKTSFRARAEFRVFHKNHCISYALTSLQKQKIPISECPILLKPIQNIFQILLKLLETDECLYYKLFGVDFLATLSGELLITLLYHKPLDEIWQKSCESVLKVLQKQMNVSLIGRSRGQKIVLGQDCVLEQFIIENKPYQYYQYENAFSQPNPFVNLKMIQWVCDQARYRAEGDLLELYCGSGNFTLPLSQFYKKTLATELSKISLKALQRNLEINTNQSIQVARMSALEIKNALLKVRDFKRLAHIALDDYSFSTLFVDPPRSGLGKEVLDFAKNFKHIIYVSCNPNTLLSDLQILSQTHSIDEMAVFDQFPYTTHLESAMWLTLKNN